MKRTLLTATIAIFSTFYAIEASAQALHYVANTREPDAFLALRSDPSVAFGDRILKMRNGTALEILDKRSDGWWRVRVVQNGQEGWAKRGNQYVDWILCCTQSDAATRPIRSATVLPPPLMTVAQPPSAPAQSAAPIDDGRLARIESQMRMLQEMLAEQRAKASAAANDDSVRKGVEELNSKLASLERERASTRSGQASYSTSVKPNDRDLGTTSRLESISFPRVPFYIPGTKERGEFWVEPIVNDKGEQRFVLKFIDAEDSAQRVRSQIELSEPELIQCQQALGKLKEWSDVAHRQNLRRAYEKRVTCFPEADCPPDGQLQEGKTSTEIRFNVYDDGSTAGRIQRNKGRFVEGYNFSIESATLLLAYIDHVMIVAKRDYSAGTKSKGDLDKLFE